MSLISQLAVLATAAAILAAAVIDFVHRRIPNPYVLVIVGGTLTYLSIKAPGDLFYHLVSSAVASLTCIGLFHRGIIGGGDAKLIAALSLWFLPKQLFVFTLWVLISGGVLGALFVFAIFARLAVLRFAPNLKLPQLVERAGMPYGVAAAAGFAIAIWRVGA